MLSSPWDNGPDRMTATGRASIAHWLGVGEWLRAHPPFQELPPASVAVWDRYLAYGVALDVMPHAVRALDLTAVGDRDVVQTERGPVRVRYPSRGLRLLRPFGPVAAQARVRWAVPSLLMWFAVGALAVAQGWTVVAVVTAILVGWAAYRLGHGLIDLHRPVRITGTVLDVTVASQNRADDVDFDFTTFYYIVVDDGTSDVLRAWIVNRDVAGDAPFTPGNAGGIRPGDTITVEGQRWSRYASLVIPGARPARAPAW